MQVVHIDLSLAFDLSAENDCAMLAVLWWRDLPLGMVAATSDETPFSRATLNALLVEMAGRQRSARDPVLGAPLHGTYDAEPRQALTVANAQIAKDTFAWLDAVSRLPPRAADSLTVIICTRDRPEALARCLDTLELQRSVPGQIVVVDNSRGGSARTICDARTNVQYVHEASQGLSHARNAGIKAATRPFIAFTDDDVQPHDLWTSEVVRALEESGAAAMTGLVLPANLDTPAQTYFQMRMGGFGSRFEPVLYDSYFYEQTRPHGPNVWQIGAGANMAFRKSVFDSCGMFDARLGAGASGCSEDSEMWYRIIATGGACQYEPRAVVYHHHRESWDALHQQMRAYIRGHVSALIVQSDRFNDRGNLRRIFLQLPRYMMRELWQAIHDDEPVRLKILREEFYGWSSGLRYLLMSDWRHQTPSRPVKDVRSS